MNPGHVKLIFTHYQDRMASLTTTNLELIPEEFGYRAYFVSLVENGIVAKCVITLHNDAKITIKTATPTEVKVPPFYRSSGFGEVYNRWDGYNMVALVDIMEERYRYSKFWNSIDIIKLYQTDSAEQACYGFSVSDTGIVNIRYRRHHSLSSWDQWVTYGVCNSEKIVLPDNASV